MLTVIKSEAQYDVALNRRGELKDIIATSEEKQVRPEIEELEVLNLLIDKYEKEHYPDGITLRMIECPFAHDLRDLKVDLHRQHGYFVFCNICKASGPYGKDKLEGIEKWNNRKK